MSAGRFRPALMLTVLALSPALLCSLALASSGGEATLSPEQILWELGIKFLDVAVIAFFGFKFLSKPITRLMETRSEAVRRALEEASAGRREAEAKLKAFEEKTARIDAEVEQLRLQACAEIDREQKILFEEARASAERVRQHAQDTIRQEVAKARAQLHHDAAVLAVRLATETVTRSISPEDRTRLVQDYLREMETTR